MQYVMVNLLKHHFSYDLWLDVTQPKIIVEIMFVLMEIDLFFDEIYNIIYQQIIML